MGTCIFIPFGGQGTATLRPTDLKTTDYTAQPGEFVRVDTTAGDVNVGLADGNADGDQIGVLNEVSANAVICTTIVPNDIALTGLFVGAVFIWSEAEETWYLLSTSYEPAA